MIAFLYVHTGVEFNTLSESNAIPEIILEISRILIIQLLGCTDDNA